MDPEERRIIAWKERPIKLLVILISEGRGLFNPSRVRLIDHPGLIGIDLLAILPLLLLPEDDRHWEVAAVLLEQCIDAILIKELLVLPRDVEDDVRPSRSLLCLLHLILRIALAGPADTGSRLVVALSINLHLVRDHKGGVESETEVPDDTVLVLVLLDKLLGTADGDLIDVLMDLIGSHTDTIIRYDQLVAIDLYLHLQVSDLSGVLTLGDQSLQLLYGIHAIAYDLSEEDLIIAVEEFFNDREHIVARHANLPCRLIFIHDLYV